MQGCQRKYQTDRRAVGIGYDESLAARPLFLNLKRVQMVRIDFWNQQRDIRFHAMTGRVAEHGHPRLRQLEFGFFCNRRRESGQDEVTLQPRLARLDGHPRHDFRNGSFQHPARSLSIVLARGIIGCSNSGDFKPRVPVEQLNHPLADRAGGAEYSYFELAHSFFERGNSVPLTPNYPAFPITLPSVSMFTT